MSTNNQEKKSSTSFEQEIYESLKFFGLHLPDTDEEIQEFVETFGDTKVELPESIADAKKLFEKISPGKEHEGKPIKPLAWAAQGQKGEELPDYILKKLDKDIQSGKRISNNNEGDKE